MSSKQAEVNAARFRASSPKANSAHSPWSTFHVVLLCAGLAFLLADSFHGNIWFDETYSVAIARFSFQEIWSIGSSDVHPVLYYWMLHVLYLVFGDNWVVYRIFTALGAWGVGLLGYTHVRRLFGEREGIYFSFLALFLPYISIMANQIRMYSWATFAVTLCALSAFELFAELRRHDPDGSRRATPVERIPVRRWIVFALTSLSSAYLQYFGALSAFFINLFLLVYLLFHARSRWRNLLVFFASALIQVAAYLPWLYAAVFSQTGVVSDAYWAVPIPGVTDFELATYLFIPAQIAFALRGGYGLPPQILAYALLITLVVLFVIAFVWAVVRLVRLVRERRAAGRPIRGRLGRWALSNNVLACIAGFAFYAAVLIAGNVAGVLLGRFIMYYRYLFVAMGPFVLAIALLFAQMRANKLVAAMCACILALGVLSTSLLIFDDYSAENRHPLDYFESVYDEAKAEQAELGGQTTLVERSEWDELVEGYNWEDQALEDAEEAAGVEGAEGGESAEGGADGGGDEGGAGNEGAEGHKDVEGGEGAAPFPLVLSSDIGIEGVTAVTFSDIPQVYMDWQKGEWNQAYECYAPTLTSISSWEEAVDSYHGHFLVLGQSANGDVPRDINDLDGKQGCELESCEGFWRPYERTYFFIAVMYKS